MRLLTKLYSGKKENAGHRFVMGQQILVTPLNCNLKQ